MPSRGPGRPQVQIDKSIFENLCAIQCTQEEIACCFNCTDDTINNWCKREYGKIFSEVFKAKRKKGLMSLRRIQWKLAEKSPAMAIFLGKNLLGQRDRPEPTGFDPRTWNTSQGEGAADNGYTGAEAEVTDS